MIRYSVILILALASSGCFRAGAAGGIKKDPICFSRAEVARISAFKIRCRAKIKELRAAAGHKAKSNEIKATKARDEARARLASCRLQSKRKCAGCLQSAIVVGIVAGLVGIGAGVATGAGVVLALQGELKK
jgi:hypothetical protein